MRTTTGAKDILAAAIWLLLGFLALSSLLYQFCNLDITGFLPEQTFCLFRRISGIRCPGCGMTRAMIRLSQFQFRQALALNCLVYPLLLTMILYLFRKKLKIKAPGSLILKIILFLILTGWLFSLTSPGIFL